MKRKAGGAVLAQAVQAAVSLVLQVLVIRLLGIEEYGRFAILYGVVILATGMLTGLVGDALVVLDRGERSVRAGLEIVLGVAVAVLGIVAGLVAALSGFSPVPEAMLFAAVLIAFGVEEIVRRLLMANMLFVKVAVADLLSFAVVIAVVASFHVSGTLSLAVLFGGIAAGQCSAILAGWTMVPTGERRLVRPRQAAWREVLRYGFWRGLQQLLRPSLFTIVRLAVLAAVGAGAVGLLEAARTYASPLLLVVGGLSSFLFVRFAGREDAKTSDMVREADRVVLYLVAATVLMSGVALLLVPWASPLIFGLRVDPLAVVAWLAYGVSVAFVTPYGALGAVVGRQVGVFVIRLTDTVLAILATFMIVVGGASAAVVPFGLALASLLGGLGLRWLVTSSSANGSAQDFR